MSPFAQYILGYTYKIAEERMGAIRARTEFRVELATYHPRVVG